MSQSGFVCLLSGFFRLRVVAPHSPDKLGYRMPYVSAHFVSVAGTKYLSFPIGPLHILHIGSLYILPDTLLYLITDRRYLVTCRMCPSGSISLESLFILMFFKNYFTLLKGLPMR